MRRVVSALARRRLWRIPVALWIAVAVLMASGGAAYAYFKTSASGTGHATVGGIDIVTVTAATPSSASLYPGAKSAVYFTIKNTNSLPVSFTRITSDVIITSSTPSACPSANVTVSGTLPRTITGVSAGAKTTSGTESIATFVQMSVNSPTGCQGKTFSVTITLRGKTT